MDVKTMVRLLLIRVQNVELLETGEEERNGSRDKGKEKV
jgi:hypothetical protein